ncbi:hypothetical protein MN869_18555 [Acinetobacter sp. NIPH1876]|uniref:hypothetical protein n=1 Tax=Acinetobacter sp. NIPH1876 TaxID=2924041 RepID=UPI001FAC7246|nr:hypothetical protein [Acinetobacter sp. NIPH1876]MCJ0830419.1 hypothetical protein [Acinetobacter sp. NIPH1876]
MKKDDFILTFVFIFVVTFGYFGWFMAELDNQALQQQITTLKYDNEIKGLENEHR